MRGMILRRCWDNGFRASILHQSHAVKTLGGGHGDGDDDGPGGARDAVVFGGVERGPVGEVGAFFDDKGTVFELRSLVPESRPSICCGVQFTLPASPQPSLTVRVRRYQARRQLRFYDPDAQDTGVHLIGRFQLALDLVFRSEVRFFDFCDES